jgi:monoterpene epsilon-lactone hydrolase
VGLGIRTGWTGWPGLRVGWAWDPGGLAGSKATWVCWGSDSRRAEGPGASGARASLAAGVYSVAGRVLGCEDSDGAADGGREMASEQLKTVLELVGSAGLGSLTLQESRALMGSAGAPPPEGTQVDPVDANGVPAEWVVAGGVTGERVMLYFHGGAYHLGSPARLRGLLALVSAAAQARVLSAGYRLAPEHPFPAAVEDALTAYRWLITGGTPARQVVISGDSSGGGLALAALVALRDAGDPLPGAAVVISPWTDLDLRGESLRSRAAVDVMLTPDGAREAADWYLAGQDARHPYASPLYADLRGLPPVLIQAGDAEIMRDDSVRFAAAAQDAGVDVTLEIWADMPHVWHAFAGLLPEADEAVERIGRWLREDRPPGDGP